MPPDLREQLARLRSSVRQSTVAAAVCTAVAVVLIPFAWRTGLPGLERWLLLGFTGWYLALSTHRVLGGFQADRQVDLEERFLLLVSGSGRLMSSARSDTKVWRGSAVVQGIERVLASEILPADVERKAERLLRHSLGSTRPPVLRSALVVLLLVIAGWFYAFTLEPALRSMTLYLALVPSLVILAASEIRLAWLANRQAGLIARSATLLAGWIARELDGGDAEFRHRVLYRDRAEEIGLPT